MIYKCNDGEYYYGLYDSFYILIDSTKSFSHVIKRQKCKTNGFIFFR